MRRVPFLSLPGRIVATRDSQAFAETVSLMLRLQDCDSLLPAESFASRTGVVQLGQVSVLATSGSPIHAVAEAVEQSTFMLPYQDCDGDYSIEGKPYSNNYGGNILHIPPVGWTLQSQSPMGAGFSRARITFWLRGIGAAAPGNGAGDAAARRSVGAAAALIHALRPAGPWHGAPGGR